MTAYIGYSNIIDSYTSKGGTDESVDYPLDNALNWNLYDVWMPGVSGDGSASFYTPSSSVDYLALHGHNVSGSTISLARWTGLSYSTFHTFTASDQTTFERFSPVTDDRWRITISGLSPSSYITLLSMGSALQLSPLRVPFAPPPKAHNSEIINNVSVENIPLGRVTRKTPFPIRIDQTIVPDSWIDANSEDLINHINAKPFFFTWDDAKDDACICWTDDAVDPPRYKRYGYQDFSIKAWGLR